jgi:hypothetical protein
VDKIRPIFLAGAPSLTTILLSGTTLQSCLPPLITVTSLHLHKAVGSYSLSKFLAALIDLPALTHLMIGCELSGIWPSMGTIEIPLLHSLQIRPHFNAEQIPGLLYIISAPLLHSLLLETLVAGEVDCMHRTLDMTAASRYPSLRFLTVVVMCTSEFRYTLGNWRTLMRLFPTVEHFVLATHEVDGFLRSFDEQTYPPDSPSGPHWPDLHTLTLVDRPSYDLPTELRTAVSARINADHPLRKLQLSKSILAQLGDDLEWLRERVEVEEDTLYPDLQDDAYVMNWPGLRDDLVR